MSLINDALKRANQFPQPPLMLRETSTFRPVEFAKPPSLARTLLVLILTLLAPLSWVVYRTAQTGAAPGETAPPLTAQARPASVPPPLAPFAGASPASAAESAGEPARAIPASVRTSAALAPGPRVNAAAPETTPPIPSLRLHTIKPGETPTSIARRYGIKLQALLEANPSVNARRLQIGQALQIPPC